LEQFQDLIKKIVKHGQNRYPTHKHTWPVTSWLGTGFQKKSTASKIPPSFSNRQVGVIHIVRYYTFIVCWWGKYENVFPQEYHILWGQRPRGIWYSWV